MTLYKGKEIVMILDIYKIRVDSMAEVITNKVLGMI